jgi:hypothetical protein
MGEAKIGNEFITHEFDEAIAIQRSIVKSETTLSTKHPVSAAKTEIKSSLADDQTFLERLEKLGKAHHATGKVEDVAEGMTDLMTETLKTATSKGNDSDYYEAHAVLVSLKRKQMDSAGGMLAIATHQGDDELKQLATAMQRVQKASSTALANSLATYAVGIAASK